MEQLYLGHTTKYWLELQQKALELDVVDYIQEIADLRGKLSLIQDRLNDINQVLK